ncbi:hypothetical protein QAD02_019234 [Eretmocerus hayati]|uniref:Uncharacterized protein n=1 Tax=Eretmocerus hayati TaxID=131215 RepID=A0ACC2PM46_9HYME|nr:hypothetical protein QAD02_019234 [Eretmocerus hayati]
MEDPTSIKAMTEEQFCELCNTIINASVTDNEKLHIEACRTLDIILPETSNRNFDFFHSVLQLNRKKRLKILVSLSILKDETVAVIASKLSILRFLEDCLLSIQPKSMNWLLPENADNADLLKSVENRVLSDEDKFEEEMVDKCLQLLNKLCVLSSLGLNVRSFDLLIMEKVLPVAYMGYRKQRYPAIKILQESAKNDLGIRVKSLHSELWEGYKTTLQNVYCKRMTVLVNSGDTDWAPLWEFSITFIGTDLHRGSGLVNSLLKVEELAFKSADPNRRQAFLSWKLLIDNFALNQRELATSRRIKLLCVPLNAKNSKTELMVLTKLEVWWHLINKIYPSITECIDTILIPYLTLCFGPFDEKPLFVQKNDNTVSLGKKFAKTQIFAIETFLQLIANKEDLSEVSHLIVQEKVPNSVGSAVFERIYKIFIHCIGEIIIILGLLPVEDFNEKVLACKVIWKSLMRRIEEYDKMKVSMYKEISNVISELVKKEFHKMPEIKKLMYEIFLKNFHDIESHLTLSESTLEELVQICFQVDDFSSAEHYVSIESLLWRLIKPKGSDIYYPPTMELMQALLKILENAKKTTSNSCAIGEVWCILARIAKKYAEDGQNINEGSPLLHNFTTFEKILAFPFNNLSTDEQDQLRKVSDCWKALYKQFEIQVELVVTVKPNEILNKMSSIIMQALKKEEKCCHFANLCFEALLINVNYHDMLTCKSIPVFVQLLKELSMQSFRLKVVSTDKILKALSAFLLNVFSHSLEKTHLYLESMEPPIRMMLTERIEDSDLENEVSKVWSCIVGLFKKFSKPLNGQLLSCYREAIVSAVLHLNKDISSVAFSILDMKNTLDDKSKKVLEDIENELGKSSAKLDDMIDMKERSKKKKNGPTKAIGSFLNRKNSKSSDKSPLAQNGNHRHKIIMPEPDSQDFVIINTDVNLDVNCLTEHQKELLKKRRKDDIPALYNDLTASSSQDSQELQHWFDTRTGKSPVVTSRRVTSNNNDESKTKSSTLQFKNITQNLSKNQSIATDKPTNSEVAKGTLPKEIVEMPLEEAQVPTIDNSPKKDTNIQAPVVAKKLNFDSRDEFPENSEQISPSIIESKVRRRSNVEESNGAAGAQGKKVRNARRSIQLPPPMVQQDTLRRSSSSEQLNKRGKKRRNSESNSESMLDIEREKRQKLDVVKESVVASTASSKTDDVAGKDSQDSDDKKISKRQMNEMSRLKIDMVFEPLPSRRSIGKSSDNPEKKTTPLKDEKSSDSSTVIKSEPLEQIYPQRNIATTTRRSLKGTNLSTTTKIDAKTFQKKEVGQKKDESLSSKPGTRRSLIGKICNVVTVQKCDADETQEVIDIEDVTTQVESTENVSATPTESPDINVDEMENSEIKSSQDSDIIESSQEPSFGSKLDKIECLIKLNKVEVHPTVKTESILDDDERIIAETPMDASDISIVPSSVEVDGADAKKSENDSGKQASSASLSSSPRSGNTRLFRSRAFPLNNRAAQMLGLVNKQPFAEKSSNADSSSKSDAAANDEVIILPVNRKEKSLKETDREIPSPRGGRQEKIFNNMNNLKQVSTPDRCASPSMAMFANLKNDGEKISPKLDKHDIEIESNDFEREISCDDSPSTRSRRELPILEWSNANPPSLTVSPSASILKRLQESDSDTPGRKKRVSFADPPVSREMGYEIMTDSSSPPRLEKLPSIRSPVSRKESRRQSRLRLIQLESDRVEKENGLNNSAESDSYNELIGIPGINPKLKLSTVLSEIPDCLDKCDVVEITSDKSLAKSTETPVEEDGTFGSEEIIDVVKTSTQNDQSQSSVKLDSINMSNILSKSVGCLEDTVDVHNISSSLESLSERPARTSSHPSTDASDTLPVTDSIFSNLPNSQETQNSVAQLIEAENLDSTLPVYPSLTSCAESVQSISADLVDPLFTNNLSKHLDVKSIHSVGDLAQMTERDINRLPIKTPKIDCVKKALLKFEMKACGNTPDKRTVNMVSSSTPLGNKRKDKAKSNDLFDEVMKNCNNSDFNSMNVSAVYESKRPKRQSTDTSMQTSPMKRASRLSIDSSMQTSPAKVPKKSDEVVLDDIMEKCNEEIVFKAFLKRFDAEKILLGYKEKVGVIADRELKKKTLDALDLSEVDDSEASCRAYIGAVGIQKHLQLLPRIIGDDARLCAAILEAYKNKFKVSKVIDHLEPSSLELLSILMNRLDKETEAGENDETTHTMFRTLAEKLSAPELLRLFNEAMEPKLQK